MPRNEAVQKRRVQPVRVTHKFVKMVEAVLHSKVQCDVAQLMLMIDEQRAFPMAVNKIVGEMHGEGGCANASLGAVQRNHAARALFAHSACHVRALKPQQRVAQRYGVSRLAEELIATGTHRPQKIGGIDQRGERHDAQILEAHGAQTLHGAQGQFRITVTVHHGHTNGCCLKRSR